MTKDEADTLLYLVDELRKRGARQIAAGGVTATFDALPGEETPERERKPPKTYEDRLFRHLRKQDQRK